MIAVVKKKQHKFHWKNIKPYLWPQMGWKRLVQYYKHRVGRLPGTPQMIAGGIATGIAMSVTPFVGLHILMGLGICYMFGFSVVAMIIGTFVGGNFWTFPFIWPATYKLGKFLLHGEDVLDMQHNVPVDNFELSSLLDKPFELLLPMTIGCFPLVLISWFVSFYFFRGVVAKYQTARQSRIYKNRGQK